MMDSITPMTTASTSIAAMKIPQSRHTLPLSKGAMIRISTAPMTNSFIAAPYRIMPNAGPLVPNLLDLGCLFCVLGLYLAAVLYGIKDYPLVPIGDPRLSRALDFENA